MSAPISSSPFNLEHLKKHAKHLLRACRAGETAATSELQAALPRLRALSATRVADVIQLADVHQALAHQHGFASWADLIRHGDPLARLLTAVRGGHVHTLRRDVIEFASLATVSVHAASALGNSTALARHLMEDPSLATAMREAWPPLMYACASPLARFSTRHATSLADCADLLLDAGADASLDAMQPEAFGGRPATPIVRAMMSTNLAIVTRLRARGVAQPYEAMQQWMSKNVDREASRMHAAFSEYFQRPDVRERMQQAKASFDADRREHPGVVPDLHDLQRLRLPNLIGAQEPLWRAMLDRGFEMTVIGPGGQTPLHSMVQYAPVAFIEFYLSRGGDVTVRDAQGRSILATAVRAGNLPVADVLRARGVVDDATPVDGLIGACLAGDGTLARALVAESPTLPGLLTREDADVFVRAGARGDLDQVTLLLDVGIGPDARDPSGATALHHAAWRGQVEVVRLLLSRGASVAIVDELYGQTPHAWALHGARHAQGSEDRCVQVADKLDGAV